MEKYCRARQARDDNMAHARWLPKSTNTLSEYVIFIAFHCNNGCMNGLIVEF